MIVVDSSALVAILLDEPEKQIFEDIIAGGQDCIISAVNAHETACVLRSRFGPPAVARHWRLLADCEIEIAPFDEAQMRAAAFDRYGEGVNSKARLNLADCAAYALAVTMNAPLLFKGDDFSETDVRARRGLD
jgi:ribonuclease VapC